LVEIFERYGFIWGGKWLHYDTMHFEFRPDLIDYIQINRSEVRGILLVLLRRMSIKGKLIKIGRAEDNHIVCAHQTVNKYHAELFVDADGNVFLTDLSSMNGSFVNGKRAYEPVLLKEGDVLKIAENITIDWQRVLPKKRSVELVPENPVTSPRPKEQVGSSKPSFEPEKPLNPNRSKKRFSASDFIKNYWDVCVIYAGILLMLLIIRLYIG